MNDVFDQIAALEADRSAFLEGEWLKIARLAAKNKADVGTVRSLLDLTGRPLAEFRDEVDHIRRITELRATVAATDRARAAFGKANREFLDFCSEKQARFIEDAEETNRLTRGKQIAQTEMQACDEARRQLEAMGEPLVAASDYDF
ncbi:MAG: hypothetical protein ACKV2Q_16880 [Planctomycetaceae bacterium]